MKHHLTERDLGQIFINSQIRRRSPVMVFFKFFGLFFFIFLVIFSLLNFSALKQKVLFWWNDEFGEIEQGPLSSAIYSSGAGNSDEKIPNISDNSIYIESINIKAPITFRVPNEENIVADNLKNGLIQLQGTSLPGEKGNIFITGHSSNFPWVRNQYNSVFALLDKLVVGDLILVKFQNKNYIYQVRDKFITSPTNLSVLDANNDKSTLTLMTCTPIGTNLKRLIIRAEQILPDPATNRQSSAAAENKNLPEGVH